MHAAYIIEHLAVTRPAEVLAATAGDRLVRMAASSHPPPIARRRWGMMILAAVRLAMAGMAVL
jgi:hypothetical protein